MARKRAVKLKEALAFMRETAYGHPSYLQKCALRVLEYIQDLKLRS